jgi:hypothetical protein
MSTNKPRRAKTIPEMIATKDFIRGPPGELINRVRLGLKSDAIPRSTTGMPRIKKI